MKLGLKAKRNIGLVVITLAIVVAIILVIYFVQKNDDDNKLRTGAIGDTVSTSQADIHVTSMSMTNYEDGLFAEDGKCFLVLSVEIKANKKITVSSDKFEVKDGKNLTAEDESVLKKGKSKSFRLVYEVERNRIASYFLYAYGARIDLGGTAINMPPPLNG